MPDPVEGVGATNIDPTVQGAGAAPPSQGSPNPPALPSRLTSEQIEAILERDVYGQLRWYEQKANNAEASLAFWTWVGIIFGFISTILAALPVDIVKAQVSIEWVKWAIVLSTAITTVATGTIAPRYRRISSAREAGRVKTAEIEKTIRINLTYRDMTDQERNDLLFDMAKRLMGIESTYGSPDTGQDTASGAGKSAA